MGQVLYERWQQADRRATHFMGEVGPEALRVALGIVYLWFGLLKVIGRSPVSGLVAETVYWVSPKAFVPILGVWEMAIGVGLLFKLKLRTTLGLFLLQVIGTFMTLLIKPRVAFQTRNPVMLTREGEFIIKNLVLLTAAVVVASRVRRER